MRYEIMGTMQGGFRDNSGAYWYEVNGGAGMGTFEAVDDAEARRLAAQAFEGHIVDEDDPRAKIIGRGSPDFVASFVSNDEDAPYVLRKLS